MEQCELRQPVLKVSHAELWSIDTELKSPAKRGKYRLPPDEITSHSSPTVE